MNFSSFKAPKEKLIDFVGIGAPRCATTWIYQCLKEHPQICMSVPKETNYFLSSKKTKDYKSYFKDCKISQLKGEFSTHYIFYPDKVIPRMKTQNQNVKLIVCLRNPIERAYSHYLFNKSFGGICSFFSFRQALNKEKILIKGGLYYSLLKKFYASFPRENILVLIYEDIQKDPLKFIQNIFKFLKVDDSFVPPSLNKKLNPRTDSRLYFPILSQTISKFVYYSTKKQSGILFHLYKFLKGARVSKLTKVIRKINLRKRPEEFREYPSADTIDRETRKFLQKIFSRDIKNLEKLINRDLDFWK